MQTNGNEETMLPKNIWTRLLEEVLRQGFTVIILLVGLYFMHEDNMVLKRQQDENRKYYQQKISDLEAKVDECNKSTVAIYQEQNEKFIQVMENISKHLKEL